MEKIFKIVDKVAYFFSAFFLAAMVLTIFLQVVTRTMHISLAWTTEISNYLFVLVTFSAAYLAARRHQMIGVELIGNMFPFAVRKVIFFTGYMAGALFYGYVVFLILSNFTLLGNEQSTILHIPMTVIYGGMMICMFFMALYFVVYGFEILTSKSEEKKEIK